MPTNPERERHSQGFLGRCLVGVEGDPIFDPVGLETVCCFPFEGWLKSFAHRSHRVEKKKNVQYIDMAEGGHDERDPLMDHTDDRGDDDDCDTTDPFQPGSASTPVPGERIPMRTTTTNRPSESWPETTKTSFIEGPGNL